MIFSISKGLLVTPLSIFLLNGKMIMRNELKETTDIILLVEKKLQTKIHHAPKPWISDWLINHFKISLDQTKDALFAMERHYKSRDGSPYS